MHLILVKRLRGDKTSKWYQNLYSSSFSLQNLHFQPLYMLPPVAQLWFVLHGQISTALGWNSSKIIPEIFQPNPFLCKLKWHWEKWGRKMLTMLSWSVSQETTEAKESQVAIISFHTILWHVIWSSLLV